MLFGSSSLEVLWEVVIAVAAWDVVLKLEYNLTYFDVDETYEELL